MFDTPSLPLTALAFVLVLGPLVFLHEFGHYIVARWCGVKAETFSIGFGRELFGWTDRRGTRWKVGWLQLGGYVQFAGDMSPASNPDAAWRKLPPAERARTFPAQALWKRAAIVAAGPVVNFIVALALIAGLGIAYGKPYTPPVVESVMAGSAAAAAGLAPGDRFVSVEGRPVESFEDVQMAVFYRPGISIPIEVERDGTRRALAIVPRVSKQVDRFGNEYRIGLLGVVGTGPQLAPLSPIAAPGYAIARTGEILSLTGKTIGQVISGRRSIKEFGGPLRIAKISGEQVTLGLFAFLSLVALMSINLGFINLLPIPMLDGGHLMFYAIEAVRRKPPGPKALEWAFGGGFAFVVLVMLVFTFNDVDSFGWLDTLGRVSG
ncbi:MAG: RIP metalloprotease RseP [Sphingomonadales bacterium]|nr:RIP metalloprotease RseP [Sphingomonadales bacterium]